MANKKITSRDVDFAKWYTDVVSAARLAAYSNVKGCIILEPAGYAIWEKMQQTLDKMFKETGHKNIAMPMLIPENLMKKEGELINGFAPEVAWVTMGGSKSSKRFDGKPESRVMSLGKSGDKIFINMTAGKGKIGDTGLIVPDGQPDKKISVAMPIDKFRSMIIYTNNWVNGYLAHMTTRMVREAEEARKNATNKE